MTDLLTGMGDLGALVQDWCLTMNATTLALLAMALLADLVLARRLSPAWRMALYLPVFVRLLLPMGAAWVVPGWSVSEPGPTRVYISEDPVTQAISASIRGSVTPPPASIWPGLTVAAYALGVAAMLLAWLRSAILVRYTMESATPTSEPDVMVAEHAGPMVAGLIGSRIIIPKWLVGSGDLPMILAHERAHIARRDPALAFCLRLACTLAWPIVPVWFAASRVRALMEQACDEHAIGTPSTRSSEAVMHYARVLIDVAQQVRPAGGTLPFGASLRSRVRALRAVRRWPKLLQTGLAMALPLTLLACSTARPSVEKVEPPRTIAPFKPESETRLVAIRMVRGEVSVPGGRRTSSSPDVRVGEKERVFDTSSREQDMPTDSWPQVLVALGQQAEVRMTTGGEDLRVQVVVEPSASDEVRAVLSYSEGSKYALSQATLSFKRGQCCVIRIPSGSPDVPTRSLVVTIDRPSEAKGIGC